MFVVEEKQGKIYGMESKEISEIKISPLAKKVLGIISREPAYPKDIAKKLRVHEQKIYYHIRNLEKSGMIKIERKEERGGALAKYYSLTTPSFFMRFGEFRRIFRIPRQENVFLQPFIKKGKFDAKIVVGSPDPHGPERARSRDAYYAIDLGIFLGTFLSESSSSVVLDTEMHSHDMRQNLILIGGPVINRVTKAINEKMPVRFDEKKRIYSSITKKTYASDDHGLIVKISNPFNPANKIIILAGKRYSGTRATILAFLKKFDAISSGNERKKAIDAKVVEGIDEDSDGIVDEVRVLE